MGNDLISRDALKEAIKRINYLIKLIKSPRTIISYCQDEMEALDLAIKVLEDSQDEWVPVSEGLPKKDNDYLITYVAYGGQKIVSKSWFNTHNGFIYDNVIAWQPLPEPYRKGGTE